MKALEWTDKLKATLKPVDFNDMKARALLNLGKVFCVFFLNQQHLVLSNEL